MPRETLNPWKIEHDNDGHTIMLRIVSDETGEIRQIRLDADDIDSLAIIGSDRVREYAEIVLDTEGEIVSLEPLLKLENKIHRKLMETEF